MSKVLIACEYTQVVTEKMREKGIEAYSCDVLPTTGNHPEWHIQGDVLPLLNERWDAVIAFPPCTHLASSGARWFEQKRADGRQQQGIDFFMRCVNANSALIAVENPVGIMSTEYRKPDQIIHPYMFGDPFTKQTCLWLKGLPPLEPTSIVDKGVIHVTSGGKRIPEWYSNNKRDRDKTFPGIAKAMAEQWFFVIDHLHDGPTML